MYFCSKFLITEIETNATQNYVKKLNIYKVMNALKIPEQIVMCVSFQVIFLYEQFH